MSVIKIFGSNSLDRGRPRERIMTKFSKTVLGVLAGAMLGGAPVVSAQAEGWKQAGDILLRGRAVWFKPTESSHTTRPSGLGGEAEVSNSLVPELDLTYFLTDKLAVETIFGVTPHDLVLKRSTLGDVDLGDVWLLPATVTLQYHFDPMTSAQVSPYVGAGLNYTVFFGEDAPGAPSSIAERIHLQNSFGFALQAGIDVPIKDNWFFNLDVKHVWLDTDLRTDLVGGGKVDADIDLNPFVVGFGIGFRF